MLFSPVVHRAPKQKFDLVEHSSLKARVGGHDVDYLHPQPCRESQGTITTHPSVKTSPDLFIPDHRGPSYVVPTCVASTHVDPDCVTIPAPAGSDREAGGNIEPSIQLPDRMAEPSRISKFAFGVLCCDSESCSSASSQKCRSAKSNADFIESCHTGECDAT